LVKVLFALTYYRPHVSGLTIYVERLAQVMAENGHEVTVLTSRYSDDLPAEETDNGVRVVRVPVSWRISKGVVMPRFVSYAWREIRRHDVLSIHLPQFEASLLALLGRLGGRKPVLTYHCDLQLPKGLFNRFVDQVVFASNYLAGLLSKAIVAYTEDYAAHSRFLSKFKKKIRVIPPPVLMPEPSACNCTTLREEQGLDGKKVIGFAARFAAEKGVEYLLGAIPYILTEFRDIKILFAGEYQNVLGENVYQELQPVMDKYKEYLSFLGVLSPQQMADFFSVCDVVVLPSVNSTESFGLVQVEAMLCGTPVVASNLPGVRVPTRVTGMGETVPIRNEVALAEAIVRVIRNRDRYIRPRNEVEQAFSLETTRTLYEQLFEQLLAGRAE
jgi:glycosyltransferase involved in cell wall biosynthesis